MPTSSEFEEVCLMVKILFLVDDAIRLRFVPFALKNLAKKWLYSLAVGVGPEAFHSSFDDD